MFTMQGENKAEPGWLMPLLEAEFYSLCEIHNHKNTFFCLDCMGSILCEACLKAELHHGHHIIQVYKSTHQVAIKCNILYKLLDIRHIQPFMNNDALVVFIKQRRQKEQPPPNCNPIAGIKTTPKCQICGWPLLLLSTCKFCSIECKLNDEGYFEKQSNNNQQPQENSSKRRGRKGNPRRSPFF